MYVLKNKTILLISPQSWGTMFISKHHYAVELARRGNLVYFLNPPDVGKTDRKETISIVPSGVHENLWLIRHRLYFPYNLKFRFIALFHLLMKSHVKKILQRIQKPIDIIWSFDLGNFYPFSFFPAKSVKIFHPVDEPLNKTAINSGKGAQIIFSVTKEIVSKYAFYNVPGYFINHGLSEIFLRQPVFHKADGDVMRVGFAGNLLRSDIDRPVLLQIIKDNPEVIFECWGSFRLMDTNIGGNNDDATRLFIDALEKADNVVLHGAVNTETLAREFARMDAFLICYDIEKDQSKGTNYHKVLEYLSTGKVIISNNITTYNDRKDLIEMTQSRGDNKDLAGLFKKVISQADKYNDISRQQIRIKYATSFTYEKQIDRIESLLY